MKYSKTHIHNQKKPMFIEICLYMILLVALIALFLQSNSMMKENEVFNGRILELSYMLQVAEYQTGRPYYTSIANPPLSIETPQWLYTHIHEKLIDNNSKTQ